VIDRAAHTPRVNAVKTHCWNGHPLTGENLRVEQSGGRRCRICQRERIAAYKREQRRLGRA